MAAIRVAGYVEQDGKRWELQRHVPPGKNGEFVLSFPGSGTRPISVDEARALHGAMTEQMREAYWWSRFFDPPRK